MLRAVLRLLDSIFVIRPAVLVPVWGFALFGYYRGAQLGVSHFFSAWTMPVIKPFSWIILFSLSVGCVYILNQIADIEVDKKNGGLPLIASGIVSRMQAWIMAVITALLAIGIPLFFGHAILALLSLLSIVIGIIYSFRPLYFSGRPFFDFLTNAFGFGVIAFGCGWHCAGRSLADGEFIWSALPYFLLMAAGSISSTIPDMPGDSATGKMTTPVRIGAKNAHLLATILMVAAFFAALLMKDFFALFSASAALPLYFLYLVRPIKIFEESTYKIGGLICMMTVALLSPPFIILSSATVLATWMYFRFRHHVAYPSLIPLKDLPAPTA
jgi:4-hydroxybenzoate polyprenyltransferase